MSAAFSRMSRHVLPFGFVSLGCSHRLSYSIITSVFVLSPDRWAGEPRSGRYCFPDLLLAGKLKVCPTASEKGGTCHAEAAVSRDSPSFHLGNRNLKRGFGFKNLEG